MRTYAGMIEVEMARLREQLHAEAQQYLRFRDIAAGWEGGMVKVEDVLPYFRLFPGMNAYLNRVICAIEARDANE